MYKSGEVDACSDLTACSSVINYVKYYFVNQRNIC